jgi:hypothetical protein
LLEWNATNLAAYHVAPESLLVFSEANNYRVHAVLTLGGYASVAASLALKCTAESPPQVGGQQVGNRLIASSGLRVLDGHGFLNSALAANISTAHLVGVDRMSAKDL